jgi:hypothetical protein
MAPAPAGDRGLALVADSCEGGPGAGDSGGEISGQRWIEGLWLLP